MRQTFLPVFILTSLALLASGCYRLSSSSDHLPPRCRQLKRQMEYNRLNPNEEASWQAPSQRRRLASLYHEYGCHRIEKANKG